MTKANTKVTEKMYNVLVRPLVTEKSTKVAEANQVVFEVAKESTKAEIKTAIETLYKVKVESVNTLNRKGKVKSFRGIKGRRQDMKTAYVRLEEGQNVDLSTAL